MTSRRRDIHGHSHLSDGLANGVSEGTSITSASLAFFLRTGRLIGRDCLGVHPEMIHRLARDGLGYPGLEAVVRSTKFAEHAILLLAAGKRQAFTAGHGSLWLAPPLRPWQGEPLIVEQRIYTAHVGKLEEYLRLYEEHALPLALEVLGDLLGYFRTEIGPLNQIVHLWGYEDLNDRQRRRAELADREEWKSYLARSRPLLAKQETRVLLPTSFSPIR